MQKATSQLLPSIGADFLDRGGNISYEITANLVHVSKQLFCFYDVFPYFLLAFSPWRQAHVSISAPYHAYSTMTTLETITEREKMHLGLKWIYKIEMK